MLMNIAQSLLRPSRVAKYYGEYICLSVSVRMHNLKVWLNFTKFFVHIARGHAQSSSDSIVITYELMVLWLTSCFHTMGLMGRRTSTALCSLPAPVDMATGQTWATAAHWLGRQVCQSASARPGARSHATSELCNGAKSAIYNCLLIMAENKDH